MPDFLTTLAQRTLKTVPVIQPMIAPLFSPGLPVTSAPVEEETWTTPDHTPKQASTSPLSRPLRLYKNVSQLTPTETTAFTTQQPSNLPSTIQKQQDSVVQPAAKTSPPQPTAITEFPMHEISSIHATPQQQEEGITGTSNIITQQFPIHEDSRETLIVEHSPNEHMTLPVPSSSPIINEHHAVSIFAGERRGIPFGNAHSQESILPRDEGAHKGNAPTDKQLLSYKNITTEQPARETHTDTDENMPLVSNLLSHEHMPNNTSALLPNIFPESSERIQTPPYLDQDRATTSHNMTDEASIQNPHSKEATDSLSEQFELVQRKTLGTDQSLQSTKTFDSSSPIGEPGRGVTLRAPVSTPTSSLTHGRTQGDAPTRFDYVDTHRHTQASAPLPNISNAKQTTNSLPEQFELVQRETSHSLQPTELRMNVSSRAPITSEITSTTSEATVPSATTATTVHITIGRIDVRAITTPNPETRRAPGKTRSQLSLDDYLNGQRKGGR
jgi:hypothetical protein